MIDLANIQPPTLESLSSKDDAPESTDLPNVKVKLVEGNLGVDDWGVHYVEYLLNQALPEDPKLQAKIQREA